MTDDARTLRFQKRLNNLSTREIELLRENRANPFVERAVGLDPDRFYGTSLGDSAQAAGQEMRNELYKTKKTLAEKEPIINKAMREAAATERREVRGMKKGGAVKSSASKRADGIAQRGKTKGRMV